MVIVLRFAVYMLLPPIVYIGAKGAAFYYAYWYGMRTCLAFTVEWCPPARLPGLSEVVPYLSQWTPGILLGRWLSKGPGILTEGTIIPRAFPT